MADNSKNNNKRIKIETNEVKNETNNDVSIKMENNNNTNNKKRTKTKNEAQYYCTQISTKKLIMAPKKVSSSRNNKPAVSKKNRTKAKPILNGEKVTLVQMAVAALSCRRKQHGQDNDETLLITTRDLVFKMCDWTSRASFNVTMSNEAKKPNALIFFPDSKTMDLTAAGIAVAPQESFQGIITSNKERQDSLKDNLSIRGKSGIMFDVLRDGKVHTSTELANACGYKETNASYRVMRGSLTGKKVAEKTPCGGFCLTDMCFITNRY
jgi:hypothetical protein